MSNLSKPSEQVPAGVSHYINENFKDDFLTDIRPVSDKKGEVNWIVDVTHNSCLYHLRFNGNGELMEKDIEPVPYPGDDLEIGEGD
ncbi:MAG: hypothetical protein RL090_573 [Bacteroidota bacterium]|jgi:hypothetical protein